MKYTFSSKNLGYIFPRGKKQSESSGFEINVKNWYKVYSHHLSNPAFQKHREDKNQSLKKKNYGSGNSGIQDIIITIE